MTAKPPALTILLFGIAREIVGQPSLEIIISPGLTRGSVSDPTVGDLLAELRRQYPPLAALRSLAVAINNEYAAETDLLRAHDEIALIPPVAGG